MNDIEIKIKLEIEKAKHILLHCHPSPDPDSVGSALAMKLALEQIGKKVSLIKGDSEIPKAFVFPGVDTIVQKNFFEIDIKDFDLFIILDSGSIDMISRKGNVVFPESLMTIVMDHHVSNKGYGKINHVDANYSSTSELLYDLFRKIDIQINHDIALNLFMGMYTDTGGFRYGESGVKTLKVASELALLAPDYQKTIFIMENNNTKESLIFESMLLSSLNMYFDGKLALAYVSHNDLIKNNIKEDNRFTGYISNKLKSIIGVEIAGTLIEVNPNEVKLSFRSRDVKNYDISRLASALGGGGHKAAAGATIKISLPEAIEKVVKIIKELYNI